MPSDANPAASARARSAHSPQVISVSEPLRRSAGSAARSAAVVWNAAQTVGASKRPPRRDGGQPGVEVLHPALGLLVPRRRARRAGGARPGRRVRELVFDRRERLLGLRDLALESLDVGPAILRHPVLLLLRRRLALRGLLRGARGLRSGGLPLLADTRVLGPPARVAAQPLILDRDGAGPDGVQQRAVVRDEQEGALERAERVLERLAALQVQVVRGLVDDQDVGPGGDEDCQREAPALATREALERLLGLLPGEEEATEQRAGLVGREAGRPLRRLEDGAGRPELLGVL